MNAASALSGVMILLCSASVVRAASIPITNQGFEALVEANPDDYTLNNIPGWTISPNGFASTFRPGGEFPLGIPEGRNVAAVGGGFSISQTLSGMLTAGTNYSLSVGVGNRAGFFYGYTVSLTAGGVVLASDSVQASDYTAFANAYGTFITSTVSYLAGAGDAQLGSALGITLSAPGFSGQTEFDNVVLTSSGGTSGTPEPASFALVAAAGLCGLVIRRRGY